MTIVNHLTIAGYFLYFLDIYQEIKKTLIDLNQFYSNAFKN